jgi:hypothetical protein
VVVDLIPSRIGPYLTLRVQKYFLGCLRMDTCLPSFGGQGERERWVTVIAADQRGQLFGWRCDPGAQRAWCERAAPDEFWPVGGVDIRIVGNSRSDVMLYGPGYTLGLPVNGWRFRNLLTGQWTVSAGPDCSSRFRLDEMTRAEVMVLIGPPCRIEVAAG